MPTREEATDPKPIAVAEVEAHKGTDHYEWQTWHVERLLATSQAAAEVDSLRARLDKLQAFKDYVHQRLDAAGVPADPEADKNAEHGCRIEGRLNFVEATADSLRAQLEEVRKPLAMLSQPEALRLEMLVRAEAALTTAQGEVADLRADILEGMRTASEMTQDTQTVHECTAELVRIIKQERTAKWALQGEAVVLRGLLEEMKDGEEIQNMEQAIALYQRVESALASTRATAAAHDERVRKGNAK
jgi:uncharacterized protein YPO0396